MLTGEMSLSDESSILVLSSCPSRESVRTLSLSSRSTSRLASFDYSCQLRLSQISKLIDVVELTGSFDFRWLFREMT